MDLKKVLEMFVNMFASNRAELMKDAPNINPVVGVRIAAIWIVTSSRSACSQTSRSAGVLEWRSPKTKRTSAGTWPSKAVAGRLVATVSGVNTAAMGNHTAATTETMYSFQPCQPGFVQWASGSSRCEAACPSRDGTTARRRPEPAAPYCRWRRRVLWTPRAGSGQLDAVLDSQAARVTCLEARTFSVPRYDVMGSGPARSANGAESPWRLRVV
jgi:hypothetical protein